MTPPGREPLPEAHPPPDLARLAPPVFRFGAVALWTYTWIVCVYFAAVSVGRLALLGAMVLFVIVAAVLAKAPMNPAVRRRVSAERLIVAGLLMAIVTLAMLSADTAIAVRDNARRARVEAQFGEAFRSADAHEWHGELFPRMYYPSNKSFFLYKPNVRLSALTYGQFYTAEMQRSRTLVDSVLFLHPVTYAIGPYGVREQESLARSRVFVLGDSFAFGYCVTEGMTWPDQLGKMLGEPVYNMGISSTGPAQQLQVLEYFLATYPDSVRPRRVLWMIYEGNDLENSYDAIRVSDSGHAGLGALLAGTLPGAVYAGLADIGRASILRRLVSGGLHLARERPGAATGARYEIDGIPLPMPLYHSPRFGYVLFNPEDVDRAGKPERYVLDHPNRPRLGATFRAMRGLSSRYHFTVTVVLAPSVARLYGGSFTGFPSITPPYFADDVTRLAQGLGFGVVDLISQLAPYARTEMLYFRDDHHWNDRGNALAAQLIFNSMTRATR